MPIKPIDYKKGEKLKASDLNNNNQGILQSVKSVGEGVSYRQVGDTKISINENVNRGQNTGTEIRKAIISAIYEDYYECYFYDELNAQSTGVGVYVAKQLQNRPSFYDGASITYGNGDVITYTKDATNPEYLRDADDGSANADQVIVPTPYVGEVILIYNVNTSVTVGSTPVGWEDLTTRVWAEIP